MSIYIAFNRPRHRSHDVRANVVELVKEIAHTLRVGAIWKTMRIKRNIRCIITFAALPLLHLVCIVRVVVSEEVAVDVGVSVAVLVTLDVAVDVGVDVAVVVAVVVVVGVVVPDVVVDSDVVAEEVAELVPEDVPVLVGDVVGVESRQFAANVPSLLATIALFSAAAAASQCSSSYGALFN